MIAANELRIGNYVAVKGDYVASIIESGKGIDSYKFLLPIPLDEEWLLKFGFVKSGSFSNMSFEKGGFGIHRNILHGKFDGYNPCVKVLNWTNTMLGGEFKYVHQLQNLYFALTGKELTCQ